jgi:hypothetical protein
MDSDYQNFQTCEKLVESLNIAYNLSAAYTDSTGNSIPAITLNNETIQAIEESEE